MMPNRVAFGDVVTVTWINRLARRLDNRKLTAQPAPLFGSYEEAAGLTRSSDRMPVAAPPIEPTQ